MLYEVAILLNPTKKQKEEGNIGEVIIDPISILAADDQSAALSVVMDNSDKLKDIDRTRMEVLVRPFA